MIGMNIINEKQNEDGILLYLFAQRKLYDWVKVINHFLFWIGIGIYVFGLVPIIKNKYDNYVSLSSIVWLIVSLFINNSGSSLRTKAANYQEYVDRTLFRFPINSDVINTLNSMRRYAIDIKIKHEKEFNVKRTPGTKRSVYNWYSDVTGLPHEIARIFCQNENCHWESKLRKDYNRILVALLIVACGIYIYVISINYSTDGLFKIASAVPVIVEIGKLISYNHSVIKTCEEIEDRMNTVYNYINENASTYDANYLDEESLEMQRRIFNYRRQSVPVPNFIYGILKNKYQNESSKFIFLLKEEILEKLLTNKS